MGKEVKKPRVMYVVMMQDDLEKKYPDCAKMIRAFNKSLRGQFNEKGKAHCLCCRKWIDWEKMKVGLLCFVKTGEAVPTEDKRYRDMLRVTRYCTSSYCDGFGYDWSPVKWDENEWGP